MMFNRSSYHREMDGRRQLQRMLGASSEVLSQCIIATLRTHVSLRRGDNNARGAVVEATAEGVAMAEVSPSPRGAVAANDAATDEGVVYWVVMEQGNRDLQTVVAKERIAAVDPDAVRNIGKQLVRVGR